MTAVDISLFNTGPLEQGSHHTPSYSHYRVQHRHSKTLPSIQPSNSLMALDPRASHYPLFIEPHLSDSPTREEHLEQSKPVDGQTSTESNPTRGIIDKIKTIKLDTPALRRAQMAFQHPPRSSSLVRGGQREQTPTAFIAYGQSGEPSAFTITTARLQAAQTAARNSRVEQDGPPTSSAQLRSTSHTRNQSLQQRRTAGALTIASPTARQARGRPAGPMIWLPDEQVWLLADSQAGANATTTAGSGVAFPNSAPLHEPPRGAAREPSPSRGRTREQDASDRNRLHRSDSSPIRTQFLRLILNPDSDTSFSAQDWTATRATSGPSAVEEDAIWYAEQQARAGGRRDQDRFSPMLQQALGGVDLQLDPSAGETTGEYLTVPGEDGELWAAAAHAMRRSSTTGDIDNIASVLANTHFADFGFPYGHGQNQGQRRTIAQRRSGSLRSRVSTVGNEDYYHYAPEAALHIRDLKEVGPRRRHSADEADTPRTAGEDDYGHEWLASLVSQGIVPEGIFTPRGSISDGLHIGGDHDNGGDGAATPRGSSRGGPSGRLSTQGMQSRDSTISPARTGMSGISPIVSTGGLSRAATTAGGGLRRTSRDRWMSVSTAADERDAGDADGGDVSPVSSRGRDSLYD